MTFTHCVNLKNKNKIRIGAFAHFIAYIILYIQFYRYAFMIIYDSGQ